MGIIPIWGFQMVTAVVIGRFAKLNIPLVLVAANISIAPLIPLIIYFSLIIGAQILGINDTILFSFDLKQGDIELRLKQYVIGSVVLALVASIFFGLLTYVCFRLGSKKSNGVQEIMDELKS